MDNASAFSQKAPQFFYKNKKLLFKYTMKIFL
jgi:hypothetical protein